MPADRTATVVITDAEYADAAVESEVLERAGISLITAQCRSAADVIDAAASADALLVQYAPITAEVFEALPRLGLVSRYGVGVDVVDLAAAQSHGVWVCNVPDAGVAEVALHASALIFALLRNLRVHDAQVRAGHWDYQRGGTLRRPGELTLGIVGLGRIGRLVAARLGPWFGDCLGCDPAVADHDWPAGVTRLGLEELFARSDVVTLHLPLTPDNDRLISTDLLARLPGGAVLVNTARGGLLDLDAALAALEEGHLAGLGLDVLPNEPPGDHLLLGDPRVIITPHVGWYSVESEIELRRKAAENVVSWLTTGRPHSAVVAGHRTKDAG